MKRSLTLHYCLHQSAYWAAAAGIMSFAAAFLLEKGFPASQVGLLLGCGSILSGVTQPALATLADRARKSVLIPMVVALSALTTLMFGVLLLDILPPALFGLFYFLGVWTFDAMMPLLNSISVYYNNRGRSINYGLSRGVGSFAFSLAALFLGYVMEVFGADWMVYTILVLLPICILITLRYPKMEEQSVSPEQIVLEETQKPCSMGAFFVRYRWYCLSLAGVLFLAMFHAMTENYLIAIMGRLGGDSRHVGMALFIATVAEAPVLFFFSQVRTKISDHWLLRLAGVSFLLKSVLFLVAPSIPFLYLTQLLQMTSYGFLSPVQVYYADEKVCPWDMVKGQAFITASYTLGCAMGNFIGGQLMDGYGVTAILVAGVIIAATGTLILVLTVERKDRYRVNAMRETMIQ